MTINRFTSDPKSIDKFQRAMNEFYEVNRKLSIDDFIRLFPKLSKISIEENNDAKLIAQHMAIYDSIQNEGLSEEAEKELRYVNKDHIKNLDEYLSEMIPQVRDYESDILKNNLLIERNNLEIQDKIPEEWIPVSQPGGGITVLNIAPLMHTNFPTQKLPFISNPFDKIVVGERRQNAFEYLEKSLRERRTDTVMRICQKNSENMIGAENLDLEGQRRASDTTTQLNAQVIEFLKKEDDKLREEIKVCEQDILGLIKKNKIHPEELAILKKQNENLLSEVEKSKQQIENLSSENKKLSQSLLYNSKKFEEYRKIQDRLMETLLKKTSAISKKLVQKVKLLRTRKHRVSDPAIIVRVKPYNIAKTALKIKQKRGFAQKALNQVKSSKGANLILNQSNLKKTTLEVSMEKKSIEAMPQLEIKDINSETIAPQIRTEMGSIQKEIKAPERQKSSDRISLKSKVPSSLTPVDM